METVKANDVSFSRPEAGNRVVRPECGRPAAPPESSRRAEYPQTELGYTVTVGGDIVEPAIPEEHWESLEP